MAAPPDTDASLLIVSQEKEALCKAFAVLEAHSSAIARCSKGWSALDKEVAEIELALEQRFSQIVEKEKAFEASLRERQEALEKREGLIEVRENASLARVQEQKEAAIVSILQQRKKWLEEHNIKDGVNSTTGSQSEQKGEMAPKSEVGATQTQAMELDEAKYGPDNDDRKGEVAKDNSKDAEDREVKVSPNQDEVSKTVEVDGKKEEVTIKGEARPQLISLCEKADGLGLWKYLVSQKKDYNALHKELPSALKHAPQPVSVVLKALEAHNSAAGATKKKTPSNRRLCTLLLEALAASVSESERAESKDAGKAIADLWKSKLNLEATDTAGMAEAHSFLQLLATFQLASDYNKDESCRLVMLVAGRKQIPGVCRALGLSPRIPDMVEQLIKGGKRMEAISFIYEFNLLEKFPPVPLLKDHLKHTEGDSADQELAAVKAVLKCINDHHLEAQYSSDGLKRRLAELEKKKSEETKNSKGQNPSDDAQKKAVQSEQPKPEKKRNLDTNTPAPKKSRANGAGGPPQGGPSFRSSERAQFGGGGQSYGMPNPYGPGYGGGGGRGAYPRPSGEGRGSFYGSPSYQYANYLYGGGARPGYQGPFMR